MVRDVYTYFNGCTINDALQYVFQFGKSWNIAKSMHLVAKMSTHFNPNSIGKKISLIG